MILWKPTKQVKSIKPSKKRWSLNYCLFVLGASKSETYCRGNIYQIKPNQIKGRRSIYHKLSVGELAYWVETLWREASMKYHPDRRTENKEFYTEKFKEICTAHEKAKRILRYHGAEI